VIEIEDLHEHFGPVRALDGVSLSVAAGEVVCLIGPSGAGKSTLLRCINFLEVPTSGVVRVDGKRVGWDDDGHRRLPTWRSPGSLIVSPSVVTPYPSRRFADVIAPVYEISSSCISL